MTALITKTWFEDGVLHSQKIEANGIYKKEWVGLTDDEIKRIDEMTLDKEDAIRLTAVALQEKNT